MKILLIFCLFIAFLMCCNVKVYFSYDEECVLKISYGIFNIYNSENKKSNKQTNKIPINNVEKETEKLNFVISKVKKILVELNKSMKKHLKITIFFLSYRFGFNDAALTGMYSGVAYGIIYTLMGYIDNNFTLNKKEITITPDFDNEIQSLKLNFAVKIKLISLLITGLKIIRLWIK